MKSISRAKKIKEDRKANPPPPDFISKSQVLEASRVASAMTLPSPRRRVHNSLLTRPISRDPREFGDAQRPRPRRVPAYPYTTFRGRAKDNRASAQPSIAITIRFSIGSYRAGCIPPRGLTAVVPIRRPPAHTCASNAILNRHHSLLNVRRDTEETLGEECYIIRPHRLDGHNTTLWTRFVNSPIGSLILQGIPSSARRRVQLRFLPIH